MRDREDWIWLQPDRHLGKVFEAPSNETQVKRPEGVKLNFFLHLYTAPSTQTYSALWKITTTNFNLQGSHKKIKDSRYLSST